MWFPNVKTPTDTTCPPADHSVTDPAPPETWENPGANMLLETVLEGLTHACLLVDHGDRILFSNEAARILFMPKGRLLGRKMEAVLADRQLSQMVTECFATGLNLSQACALRLPGEQWRDDRHFLVEAVCVNLSADHRLVRVALRPDERADAAAKVVPDPAADVLVQLRGPLTIVQGYLENLLDGMITDPVALRQSLLTMRRSTLQIERILEGLRH